MPALCAVCGSNCGSSYFVTANGEPLCKLHLSSIQCHMCQSVREIISGPTIPVCKNCSGSAIVDSHEASIVAQPVLDWLSFELGPHRLNEVELEVKSINDDLQLPYDLGHAALTQYGNQGSAKISLASHQHASMLASTLAHEYGHVILTFNPSDFSFYGDFNRDQFVDEGACEVIKALWLEHSNTKESKHLRKIMESNITPVYGDGFRMMWQEYQKVGSLKGFIDHVVTGGADIHKNLIRNAPVAKTIRPDISVPNTSPLSVPIDRHRPTIHIVQSEDNSVRDSSSEINANKRPTIQINPDSSNSSKLAAAKKSVRPTILVVPPKKSI
jgi:hypothetical protein